MMAAQGRELLFFAPHVSTMPSLAIFVIVLAPTCWATRCATRSIRARNT